MVVVTKVSVASARDEAETGKSTSTTEEGDPSAPVVETVVVKGVVPVVTVIVCKARVGSRTSTTEVGESSASVVLTVVVRLADPVVSVLVDKPTSVLNVGSSVITMTAGLLPEAAIVVVPWIGP